MAWSTLEQLRALRAKTAAQKEALRREDYALCEKYPKHYVAFVDAWAYMPGLACPWKKITSPGWLSELPRER